VGGLEEREMSEGHSTYRKLMGWFLILIIGGPVVLVLSYSFLYAIMPQGANPNLVLLPLILSALLIIAVAFAAAYIIQERRRRRITTPSGTPNVIKE
jgi:uncharacterized membrane protein YbhN (UPF0104 family)